MSEPSLVDRYAHSVQRGESAFVASLAYVLSSVHAPAMQQDAFQLSIVLGTWFAYLYTRSTLVTLLVATLAYVFDSAVFGAAIVATRRTSADVMSNFCRREASVYDPIAYGTAFLSVYYALEYSVLGRDGGVLPIANERTGAITLLPFIPLMLFGAWTSLRAPLVVTALVAIVAVMFFDIARPVSSPLNAMALATVGRAMLFLSLAVVAFRVHTQHSAITAAAALAFVASLAELVYT